MEAEPVERLRAIAARMAELKPSPTATVFYELISAEEHKELAFRCVEIGRMLGSVIRNPAPLRISER